MASDPFDTGFAVKARAILLTYNVDISYDDFRDALSELTLDGDRVSYCHEHAGRKHFHAYIERDRQIDCQLAHFQIAGCTPNCQANKVKGSGFRSAADRGHFYVYCEYKSSHVESDATYHPNIDYAVKAKWLMDMWGCGKISDDKIVPALAHYRCLTPQLEAQVNICVSKNSAKRKAEYMQERAVRVRQDFRPFPVYQTVETWFEQYQHEVPRYKFLIIWGPSRTQKTEFAMARLPGMFAHRDAVSWNGYDDDLHTGVIFDDVKCIYKYISDNRALFQASGFATVQTSSTNVYARTINLCAKPIVITTNDEPTSDWILMNSFVINASTPLSHG